MAKNKLSDLRDHLFAQLERLGDDDVQQIDIDKANAASNISKEILNSAKIEYQYLTKFGGKSSKFIEELNLNESDTNPKYLDGGK
jgi:hypothetical protein